MPDEPLYGVDAILEALYAEDRKITELGKAVEKAQQECEIGTARYAAVRDMVREAINRDPYSQHLALYEAPIDEDLVSDGRYRFLLMPMGNAVLEILAEANDSLSVPQVKKALLKGGVKDVDGRAVNAALMTLVRTERVKKIVGLEGVAYFYTLVNQWGYDLHPGERPEPAEPAAESPTPPTQIKPHQPPDDGAESEIANGA